MSDNPVILPPGRARLATRPVLIGSLLAANTTGIFSVARLAAMIAGVLRGDDQIDFVLHQFRCKVGKAIEVAVRTKVFGFDGAALNATKLAYPESIFFEKAVPLCLRRWYQPTDVRALSGMLLGGHRKLNLEVRGR
jgi:hypothetical protein